MRPPVSKFANRYASLAAIAGIALVLGLIGSSLEPTGQRFVVGTLIQIIFVVGLFVFVGNSGVLSFGHMGFAAIGGYTCALVTMPGELKGYILPDLPQVLADASVGRIGGIIAGAFVAGGLALLIAVPLTKLSGLAAGLATFAFLEIVHTTSKAAGSLTGGSSGLSGIPITTTPMFAAVAVAVVCVGASFYQRSRLGRALRASRGDETAAGSVGINVRLQRIVSLVLSAVVMGAGGALYVAFLGVIGTEMFYLKLTFLTLTMLVVGGMTSLLGAVAGGVLISVLTEFIGRAQNGGVWGLAAPDWAGMSDIAMAAVLLAVLLVRPAGLFVRASGTRTE